MLRRSPLPTRIHARIGALALAVLCMIGTTAFAQAIDATPSTIDGDTRVLPVWSNASGRVEALLLLDPVDPTVNVNALDRVLNAPRLGLGLGTRVRLDSGAQVRGSLQFDADGGLALLCDGGSLPGAIVSLGEHCLLATLGNEDPLLAGVARGATLGLGWQSPGEFLDLSFGLSWLEYDARAASLATPAYGSIHTPTLLGLGIDTIGAWAQRLESQNLHVDSLINLGPQARMLLGGDLGRSRILAADGTELQWETAELSFGLGFGDFTGQLTGRLIELPREGQHWNALDIGVSWRTPWRGELSVGARNVLGGGDAARWPLSELPAVEDPSARVPYVRYQQDL
jgi:hypothetical protein